MMEFRILKRSPKSHARLGTFKTPHGMVETPAFVGVATQAVVKTLTSEEVLTTSTQILIANTFHPHLKPSENVVAKNGGLHAFMNWRHPLMTDSGGFQIFSLGFGADLETGKILKQKRDIVISKHSTPRHVTITGEGALFRSPVDGKELFIGPQESMKIQEKLGADIMFAFDECTSPVADHAYNKKALKRTHEWARICLKTHRTNQALFGIVQGGKFKDLRVQSARFIGALPFDGFGIGGEFGNSKKTMISMLQWTIAHLPSEKPRHLLGIGHLEDILPIIKEGVDLFDCITPTHYARHGYAFVRKARRGTLRTKNTFDWKYKKLDMGKTKYLSDKSPLDPACDCFVCQHYTRSYISHLTRAKEITALKLLTFHNLRCFNGYVENIRRMVGRGLI